MTGDRTAVGRYRERGRGGGLPGEKTGGGVTEGGQRGGGTVRTAVGWRVEMAEVLKYQDETDFETEMSVLISVLVLGVRSLVSDSFGYAYAYAEINV